MIITILIYIFAGILGVIAMLFPDFEILPPQVYDAIINFVNSFLEMNSLFLIVPNVLTVLIFFFKFLIYFLLYKITIKILNYLRGTGQGL